MHVIYNGQEVVISHELSNVFDFLKDISVEIKSLIGIETKFKKIQKNYGDLLEYSYELL